MSPVERGDLLAVMSAGAYGAVQSCTYNTRTWVPEVLVSGARFAVVRQPMTPAEQIARESVPRLAGRGGCSVHRLPRSVPPRRVGGRRRGEPR